MSDEVELFLDEVRAELNRARSKFPGDRIMTIALAEEFGELCKAVLDEPAANVRKEAVQTAVMAARVILDGDGSVNEWRKQKGLDRIGSTPTHYVHWNGGAWMVKGWGDCEDLSEVTHGDVRAVIEAAIAAAPQQEPGAVAVLVSAANAVLAANPNDDTMWSLEAAVAPFNARKPDECTNG